MKPSRVRAIIGIGFAFLLLVSVVNHPAQAFTINVGCDTAALTTAIVFANSTPAADTLNLAAGCLYLFTVGDAVNNDSALPRITSPITINGSGAIIARGGVTMFRLLYVGSSGSLTLDDVAIVGGSSTVGGGGIYNGAGGTVTVTNCTLSGNSTTVFGGGILNATGTLTVINSTLSGNNANAGGGIYNAGTLTVINGTLSGNSAVVGGGVYNASGVLTVTISTLSGNSAGGGGGGIYNNTGPGTLTVTNSILWGNNTPISGSAAVTFSDIQVLFPGTGNLNIDPLFVAPEPFANAPTSAGDYHLQDGSPALNVGSNAALPADTLDLDSDLNTAEPIPYDLDGNARILGGVVDMGAYELQPADLLSNGGFEVNLVRDNVPDGWTLTNATGDKLLCDPAKAHTGTCAFQFKGGVPENAKLSQSVNLTGVTLNSGDVLALSAWFKGVSASAKTKFILSVIYTGNPTPVKTKLTVKQHAAYTQRVVPDYVLTAGTVDQIKVTFQHKSAAGTVYVDDASLIHTPGGGPRGSRSDGLLPPPSVPSGFRGGN